MRIRNLPLLLTSLFLFSCALNHLEHKAKFIASCFSKDDQLLASEKVTVQLYWELGVAVTTYGNLYLKNGYENKDLVIGAVNGSNKKNGIHPKNMCSSFGEEIVPSENGFFDAKCIYELDGLYHEDIEGTIRFAFDRVAITKVIGNEYHIYYTGDIPLESPDSFAIHRKLSPEEAGQARIEHEKQQGLPAKEFFIYEFVFPLDAPVYTITAHRNIKKFKGYKPLKLDTKSL